MSSWRRQEASWRTAPLPNCVVIFYMDIATPYIPTRTGRRYNGLIPTSLPELPRRNVIILSLFMVLSTTRKVIARPKPRTYQALASSVSRYRPLRGRLFLFTLGGGDDSPAHIKTLQKLPLADPGFVHCEVAEWGYSFHHLKDGQEDGAGRKHYGGYPRPPKTRAEAMEVVRRYYLEQRKESLARSSPEQQKCVVSINGHYCYQHYACEWGCDVVGSEVGENVNSIQAHIAFTRGAARQYGKPWLIDFSDWYGPGIRDEDPTRHWGGDSGPTYGHSISLTTRTYYVSYMAGANVVVAEGGWLNGFRSQKPQADGTLPLSSLGKAMGEFYRFTRRHPDRGIPYTPIALVLPVDHGVYPGFGPKLAWHAFDYEPGDQHILDTLNVFFPGSLGDPDQAERADGQPLSPPAGDPSWNSPPYARTEALRLVGVSLWRYRRHASFRREFRNAERLSGVDPGRRPYSRERIGPASGPLRPTRRNAVCLRGRRPKPHPDQSTVRASSGAARRRIRPSSLWPWGCRRPCPIPFRPARDGASARKGHGQGGAGVNSPGHLRRPRNPVQSDQGRLDRHAGQQQGNYESISRRSAGGRERGADGDNRRSR